MDVGKYYGADWIGMLAVFVSMYFLSKKQKKGFLFAIIGNVAWLVFAIMAQSVANIVSNVCYIGLNLYCFHRWGKNKEKAAFPKGECGAPRLQDC